MAIGYNPVSNKIYLTGYTELVPCTFTDLYNADKAGTYSLHDRNGIAAVDGAAVAITNALRPTDEVVLGGASGDLYITITNWNLMTNATIRVIGTDRDGAAQTDDIVVNANGNYNTANWFKTVTHTQVTVFNTPGGGSFDYELIQGQWGRIWRLGNTEFLVEAQIQVGNWSTPTWFADTSKLIEFSTAAGAIMLRCLTQATLRLGTLVDTGDKSVDAGCAIVSNRATTLQMIQSEGTLLLYGCLAYNLGNAPECRIHTPPGAGAHRIYHLMSHGVMIASGGVGMDVYDYYETSGKYGFKNVVGALELVRIDNTTRALFCTGGGGMSAKDVVIRSSVDADVFAYVITVDVNLTNVTCDWTIMWQGVNTAKINRYYTFNLQVVDSDGVGIQNVTASMVDRYGTAVFSANTNVNGDIAEQTILYGYYDQAHVAVIEPGGVGYSPHTITISKPGYAPRTIVYTMDRLHEEIEKLGGAAPHGMEYRRRRVPGEVSALVEHE